uniref:(northern house mosquito) hypothetical protein n=1 Tax=Culex pipiens TaxID=7175 RepID=A0A8D8BM52_CULPI
MLHYANAVPASGHGWRSRWTGRYGQNGNHQRFGPCPRHHGVRVQLQRADGLQILRKYIQRTGPDRCLGLLRRVQPHLRRGAVRRCGTGQIRAGCHTRQKGHF